MSNTPDEIAREEFIEHIRAEYRDEMRDEILSEFGEEYTVWVSTREGDIQENVSQVARALNQLLNTVRGDNQLPSQDRVLTAIEQAQLIAILETALQELKAPMVDRGRFRLLQRSIGRLAIKASENSASRAMQDGLEFTFTNLGDFIKRLMEKAGYEDWM